MTPARKRNDPDQEPAAEKATLYDEWGQFIAIPAEFIDNCQSVPTAARWLFVVLRRYTNAEQGCAFPSYTELERVTGWTRATISQAIKDLEDSKWMRKELRPNDKTRYWLSRPKKASSEIEPPTLPSDERAEVVQKLNQGSSKIEPGVVQKLNSIYMKDLHVRSTDLPSLRSGNACALVGSSLEEIQNSTASDNAGYPGFESSEYLEARAEAEYRSIQAIASPPGIEISNRLIRPMLASGISGFSECSEIGPQTARSAPPPVPAAPSPENSATVKPEAKKRHSGNAKGRNSSPRRRGGRKTASKPPICHDGIPSTHPAMQAVHSLLMQCGAHPDCHYWPSGINWRKIVAILGDREGAWDQERLVITYQAWLAKGYRCQNLTWLFDWYVNGIPDDRSNRIYGSRDPQPEPPKRTYCGKPGCEKGWRFNVDREGRKVGGVHRCACNPDLKAKERRLEGQP